MAGGSSTTAVEGSSSAAPLNGGGEGGGKGGGGGGGVEEEEEVSCAVGTKIYVPDAVSVWKTAEVIKIEDDGGIVARVDADNDIVHIKKGDQFYLCNTDVWNTTGLSAPTDLTMLTHLHEAAVLDSLNLRFDIDEIYTFTGPILIAVNPFKQIAGLYDMKQLVRYISNPPPSRSTATSDTASSRGASYTRPGSPTSGGGGGDPFPRLRSVSRSSELHLGDFSGESSMHRRQSSHPHHQAAGDLSHGAPPPIPTRLPHVFASSSAAYEGMCSEKKSQTILISGESGAGKTESTKFVMKFLACAGSESLDKRSQVESQVLESNPLLEAFGNARTLRNDNSSRFGKFIELQFETNKRKGTGSSGRLCGARIQTYLLEKVRVCDQQEGERNYHIFYQLCAAAEKAAANGGVYQFPSPGFRKAPEAKPQEMDMSIFEPRDKFRYLTKSSCFQLHGVDDCMEFESTIFAMQTVGIGQEEQMNIFSVVGAVLCLGNVSFETPKGNSEASCVPANCSEYVSKACRLLGVEVQNLEEALCYRSIRTMRESYRKPLKAEEASEMKDALCRALYGCLFLQVVARTNQSIGYRTSVRDPEMLLLFCGVLDIFGFECFTFNSFEQLCINFTNERLQNFFNTFVFQCEEELYRAEGIHWNPLDFPDNADCVALLQDKPLGLFSMLDEECIVPAGKDRGFNNKICQKHAGHQRFGVIKTKPNCFVVHHFAGSVEYCTDGFLEKNKDQLSVDLQESIKASSIPFVANLFTAFLNRGATTTATSSAGGGNTEEAGGGGVGAGGGSKKRKFVTVSSEFREQLSCLMDTVNKTAPHFIRCIKPNPQNVPDVFDRGTVNEQLRYGGVLQAVQVSRAGYPVRLSHKDCFDDYKSLADRDFLKQLLSGGGAGGGREEGERKEGGGGEGEGGGYPPSSQSMRTVAAVSATEWRRRAEGLLVHLDAKLRLNRSLEEKEKSRKEDGGKGRGGGGGEQEG